MDLNDLYSIIDDYGDATFEQCKHFLYKRLFYVTPEEEIQRSEFKEKIATVFLLSKYPTERIERDYTEITEGIINRYVTLESARDLEYEKLRKQLALDFQRHNSSLESVEDYFLIFLSQCWDFTNDGNYDKHYKTKEVNYFLGKPDIETINKIWANIDEYSKPKKEKRFLRTEEEVIYVYKLNNNLKKFVLIVNSLLLFRILQYEGEL